jgi:serine/threonine-protein kinase RsbW
MGQPDRTGPPSTAPLADDGLPAGGSDAWGGRPVVLRIPAEREQVVLVRSVAGHIAARRGLSIAELTDLRLAVDEACGLFLLSSHVTELAETLECRFDESPHALRVTVSTLVPSGFEPDTEDVGWIMLGALVDELTWRAAAGTGVIALTKHLIAEA